jgi:Zn-dependent peptidase ImmA (M78 family)/DNA-binding XRE family transcriptional regulator
MKNFNPARLIQARNWRDYTLDYLAGKLDITKASISLYEKGARTPDKFIQVRLADALNFPISFFYTETPDLSFYPISYRSKANTKKIGKIKADLLKQYAFEMITFLEEYITFKDSTIKPLDVDCLNLSDKQIEKISLDIRKSYGADLSPISELMTFLENRGVFIFLFPSSITDVDGFSCVINSRPYIFINSDFSWDKIRFTLVHELGHILLHSAFDENEKKSKSKEIGQMLEKQAHYFASAFLIPEASFENEFLSTNRNFLLKMKQKWGMSMAAIIYRACQLDLISDSQKESYYVQASKNQERKIEPGNELRDKEHPFIVKLALEGILKKNDIDKNYIRMKLSFPDEILDVVSAGVLRRNEPERQSTPFVFKIPENT